LNGGKKERSGNGKEKIKIKTTGLRNRRERNIIEGLIGQEKTKGEKLQDPRMVGKVGKRSLTKVARDYVQNSGGGEKLLRLLLGAL